jgi:hypothetical protein
MAGLIPIMLPFFYSFMLLVPFISQKNLLIKIISSVKVQSGQF